MNTSWLTSSLYRDKQGNIWIGLENGVVTYNPNTDTLTEMTVFKNQLVSGFSEDINHNIWMACYDGVYRYNPTTQNTTHFLSGVVVQYLLSDPWHENQLWAASNQGVFLLKINNTEQKTLAPIPIVSSYIGDQNSESTPTSNENLKLNFQDHLILKPNDNNLNLRVSTLFLGETQDNEIQYKLENYDQDWNFRIGSETIISYKNIPPSNYKMIIKATSQTYETAFKTKYLNITVLPPWWQTVYAKTAYILLLTGLLLSLWFVVKSRHKQKIDKIKIEKEKELTASKLAFFTNVSHDIRTPLTLILGPIENLLSKDKIDTWQHKQHTIIKKNTDLLLRLVNQILDFRKLETDKTTLKASKTDIVQLIKDSILQFEGVLNESNVKIHIINNTKNTKVWIDADKMEKVFINLFSNAIKFNDYKKDISVEVASTKKYLSIKVINYGVGISSKDIKNIFNRFYQSGYHKGGSGIGLSIVKSIVEQHHGTVKASSLKNKQTCFTIQLPLGNAHLQPSEIVKHEKKQTEPHDTPLEDLNMNKSNAKDTVLLIEDHNEIRHYLKETLQDDYNIVAVNNGEWGLEKAEMLIPNLIISDIMMDGIDGIEVCRILKNNINTSHIPIILLTAKNTDEDKIDGYNQGADDYIVKPFSTAILKSRIKNLLNQRKRLRDNLNLPNITPKGISPTTVDEKFIEKTLNILKKNISNSLLSVEDLAEQVGLNQSQFYRKIKKLTGHSASKFIQIIRLKTAAQLLVSKKYKVSEVVYEVGFTSPSYFTKCFKKQFGKSPTEYLNANEAIKD